MDSSHVALVTFQLPSGGFKYYQCEQNISMGMNLNNMAKLLSCAENDDIITVMGHHGSDTATFMFESPTGDMISEFEIKLMDIASEHLRIPDVDCHAAVRMPSAEFAKICKELSIIGNNVVISVTKEGVKFSTENHSGTAYIVWRNPLPY
ncbi:hypothetical protein PIB30_013150 [Stylosanthes scabra]|uniref:DNA sliding clamp PCNA n=1 Tax=Stylosanthes scabra TaxID=79078 RepID=A0ABU6Y4X2_9FABA|nr:hypothetical protein [Stylosanthes scabra]